MSVMLLTEEHRNSQASVNADFSPGFRCTVFDQLSPARPGLYRSCVTNTAYVLLYHLPFWGLHVCKETTHFFLHWQCISFTLGFQIWDYKHFRKRNKWENVCLLAQTKMRGKKNTVAVLGKHPGYCTQVSGKSKTCWERRKQMEHLQVPRSTYKSFASVKKPFPPTVKSNQL